MSKLWPILPTNSHQLMKGGSTMKNTVKITGFLLCGLLTACSGNPLADKPTNDTARLLMKTSDEAMKKMGYQESGQSDRYRQCMENFAPKKFPCARLYKTMAEILNTHPKHLQDLKLYTAIVIELEQLSYYSL